MPGDMKCVAARTGGWDLGPVRDQANLAPLFWLALFGFGMKAGLFPLHIWLPSAHANAPSHASAMMSGVMLKMGSYGILRFLTFVPHKPLWWGGLLIIAGMLSALLGICFAAVQTAHRARLNMMVCSQALINMPAGRRAMVVSIMLTKVGISSVLGPVMVTFTPNSLAATSSAGWSCAL